MIRKEETASRDPQMEYIEPFRLSEEEQKVNLRLHEQVTE